MPGRRDVGAPRYAGSPRRELLRLAWPVMLTMGLGTIGMQERAELVGGRLEVRSAPGSGTTVLVSVPTDVEAGSGPDPDDE